MTPSYPVWPGDESSFPSLPVSEQPPVNPRFFWNTRCRLVWPCQHLLHLPLGFPPAFCCNLSQVGMSFFCQQSTVSSFCARRWVNMLFTKLFKSKAAVKKVPTLHSRFCTYWLCWFLLTAHGSALAWGILVPADCLETAWAWRKMFSMVSPTLQLEGQGKHTKEFSFPLIFFFFWTLCTSVGDGFCVTWNHSSAQEKTNPQLKNTACYCVGHSILTPTVKGKKQKLSPPAKCHANKS